MTKWAFFNGDWVDDAALSIPVTDLGFTLGVTVTERLRTFGGNVYRTSEHMTRMHRSLEIVGMDAAPLASEIEHAIGEFVQRNSAMIAEGDDWWVGAWVTPGDGRGEPTRCVHGGPLPFNGWGHQFRQGVSLWTSAHRQTPTNCWPAELKCRSRMHYYLADQEARRHEPGACALLLDQDGYVGEASTANIVVYLEDEGVVSPHMEKVLPGVSVAVARDLCAKLGVPFRERDIALEELHNADEVWLSSTSVCVLPVVRCDGKPIGAGKPGEVYEKVLTAWSNSVGMDIRAQAEGRI